MYPVNDDFKSTIYALSRATVARVLFYINDVDAINHITDIFSSSQFVISQVDQIADEVLQPSRNLITWEKDRVKLDGTFTFAAESDNGQVGFISGVLCSTTGVFLSKPSIDIRFNNKRSTLGITVVFDVLNHEYAVDFDVIAYNGTTVSKQVSVTGNTEVVRVVEGDFQDYDKVLIVINKWSRGERRARVVEVIFGVLKVYDDDKIVRLSLVEDMDILSGSIPATELKVTIDNSGKEFNILNPEGIYTYLQDRQKLILELGVEVGGTPQYIPTGQYYLTDWQSDEGALTTTFTAGDILSLLDGYDVENLTASTTKPIGEIMVDLFETVGIKNYTIDLSLYFEPVWARFKKMTAKNLLIMLLMVGRSNIYISREHTVTVKKIPDELVSVDRIDLDNMYEEPKITLDNKKLVKEIRVSYYGTDLDNPLGVVVITNPGVTNGLIVEVSGNTLINTSAVANEVGNWLLRQYNYRGTYELNWRGNPALELSDVISIETSYGDDKQAIITKNELNYEGYLSGKLQAKGVI